MTKTRSTYLLLAAGLMAALAANAASGEPTGECPLHAAHMASADRASSPSASSSTHEDTADHTARAALEARGDRHMGFQQQLTVHHFRLQERGGAIEVTARDPADATTVEQVRGHLRHIAGAFAAGDFSIPEAVHAQQPPGVSSLRAAGADVAYRFEELPAGGRVVLTAATPIALAAVQEFLRFQITDHETGDPLQGH
jgi:hypothetical protein